MRKQGSGMWPVTDQVPTPVPVHPNATPHAVLQAQSRHSLGTFYMDLRPCFHFLQLHYHLVSVWISFFSSHSDFSSMNYVSHTSLMVSIWPGGGLPTPLTALVFTLPWPSWPMSPPWPALSWACCGCPMMLPGLSLKCRLHPGSQTALSTQCIAPASHGEKGDTDPPSNCQPVEILPRVKAPPCIPTSRPLRLFVYWGGAPNKSWIQIFVESEGT